MNQIKEKWMTIWNGFEEKHPKLAKWVYQIFLFLCIQHDGDGFPVSGVYLFAGNIGRGACSNGIYVAPERAAYLWS